MARDEHDEVVRLTTAANPAQAHIWQQALREEGIKCQVVGDYLDAGLGDIPGLRAELWVHRDDVGRAQDLLGRHSGQAAGSPDEDADLGAF
jgi:hypothetical protein